MFKVAPDCCLQSSCKEAESSRRASQLQAVPHAAEVAWWFNIIDYIIYWFGNIYSSVLGLSQQEIGVAGPVSIVSLSACSCFKRQLPDATLQGAQIKQKSLRATSSSPWPEGALTLNILKSSFRGLRRCKEHKEQGLSYAFLSSSKYSVLVDPNKL